MDVYDPDDDARPQNSPKMEILVPKLGPSPSPPPPKSVDQVSSSPRPGRKKSNRRRKIDAIHGDAVLIHFLGEGRAPDIAETAAAKPLVDTDDEDGDSDDDSEMTDTSSEDQDQVIASPPISPDPRSTDSSRHNVVEATALPGGPAPDLESLAAGAIAKLITQQPMPRDDLQSAEGGGEEARGGASAGQELVGGALSPPANASSNHQPAPSTLLLHQKRPIKPLQQMQSPPNDARSPDSKPVLAPPVTTYIHTHPDAYSPRSSHLSEVLRHPNGVQSPGSISGGNDGSLPPIQQLTPRSETSGQTPLPSIQSTLGDKLREAPTPAEKDFALRQHFSSFPQPPAAASQMLGSAGSLASTPISPNFSSSLPSPANSAPLRSPYYPSSNNAHYGPPKAEFSNGSQLGSPGSDMSPGSAMSTSIADRMSIDNMTNQPTGSFTCTFAGCNAPPFQTQYLLNSHANVHSSARPHYCPVQGCLRSEGGKGFKRKNEMIRHGLVHESPGYVCPFCNDREHKYPRPDNLQRHVRVHHMDKDKDDPQLRDVLSQRADGPNRGRRRRGGP